MALFHSAFHTFTRSRRGSVVPLVAVTMMVLLISLGIVVDVGRLYAVRVKAQQASDAALLGAVSTISQTPLSTEYSSLFYANFPTGYMGSTPPALSVQETPVGSGVYTGNVTFSLPPTLATLVNAKSQTLTVTTQVTRGLINQPAQTLELTLVLDNTGSMADFAGSTTKIQGLISASTTLMNILYNGQNTLPNLTVSLVPFSTDVNIGTTHTSWIQPSFQKNFTSFGGLASNRNSDEPINAFNDQTDAPPTTAAGQFRTPYTTNIPTYANPDYDLAYSVAPLQFATTSKSTILTAINKMTPNGATRINVGLLWGWATLSPKWQGVWDASRPTLPLTPGNNIQRTMVLMTDGENTVYTGAKDRGTPTSNDDTTTLALCNLIKQQGIELYVIGFGNTNDMNLMVLESCAGDPTHFFIAPTSAQLGQVFSAIGDQTLFGTIRLTQ